MIFKKILVIAVPLIILSAMLILPSGVFAMALVPKGMVPQNPPLQRGLEAGRSDPRTPA